MAKQNNRPFPWEKSYPEGVSWDLSHTPHPMHEFLDLAAQNHSQNTCVNFLGKTYSYAQIHKLATKTAAALQNLGLKKGDRVAICLPNTPYSVIAYYAILKAGGIVVNLNPLYTQEETEEILQDSEARFIFTTDLKPIYPKLQACLKTTPLEHIINCPFSPTLPLVKRLLLNTLGITKRAFPPQNAQNSNLFKITANAKAPSVVKIDPHTDVAVIQYTGGTTGTPKGATLTHANLSTNTVQCTTWLHIKGDPDLSPSEQPEKILCVLPFFHVFAMTALMNLGIRTGSELILLPRFEINQLMKVLITTKPTLFAGVPTIFHAMNNHPLTTKENLKSLRFCISGGAPLPPVTKQKFEDTTNCPLIEGYGLSESSPVVAINPLETGGKPNSIGLPPPQTILEIRDLEDSSKTVATGEKGQIAVIGPQVMRDYWNKPEETAEVLQDNTLLTGDVGHMDEDGYFFITDRIKDVIICGGYNVYPRVIEEEIHKHPSIDEVAVIGVKDEYRGEAPIAIVTLKEPLTEKELKKFIKIHLNPLERPKKIIFREEMPKTLIGKTDKKALKQEFNK